MVNRKKWRNNIKEIIPQCFKFSSKSLLCFPAIHPLHILSIFHRSYCNSKRIMVSNQSPTLVSQGIDLYRSILSAPPESEGSDHLEECRAYQDVVNHAISLGSLDPQTASVISAIVTNVRAIASSRLAMETDCSNALSLLVENVHNLSVSSDECKSFSYD